MTTQRLLDDDAQPTPPPQSEALRITAQRLFDARTLLVCGEINMDTAREVVSQALALAAASDDPITVWVHSPGGHVESSDTIHDVLTFIRPRVRMVGTGWVASGGAHIFLAAEREDRYCLPNTRFLIHQPSGGAGGQASDIAIQAREILKARERIAEVISRETGQPMERVMSDIERDRWLSPDEAIEYGLVSKVIRKRSELK